MIYRIINSDSIRTCRFLINSIIILSIMVTYCGCSATEVLSVNPEVQNRVSHVG